MGSPLGIYFRPTYAICDSSSGCTLVSFKASVGGRGGERSSDMEPLNIPNMTHSKTLIVPHVPDILFTEVSAHIFDTRKAVSSGRALLS